IFPPPTNWPPRWNASCATRVATADRRDPGTPRPGPSPGLPRSSGGLVGAVLHPDEPDGLVAAGAEGVDEPGHRGQGQNTGDDEDDHRRLSGPFTEDREPVRCEEHSSESLTPEQLLDLSAQF